MEALSVCIICKNEEAHIEECLQRLSSLFCVGNDPYRDSNSTEASRKNPPVEIILVDTGSTDRTIAIAKKYTRHVYSFAWCDDFSAAKNYAVSKASNDWILSLDCDEYLESVDCRLLYELLQKNPHSAGRVVIRNRFHDGDSVSYEQLRVSRLFHRKHYSFKGAIHEQIEPTIRGTAKTVFDVPLTLLHVGYDLSEKEMKQKALRNIELLKKELALHGADPYLYYQLGQSYRRIGDYESAYYYLDCGISMDIDPSLEYVQTMVEAYGYTLLDLKRPQAALNLLAVYEEFSYRADFVFLAGLIYMNNGLFKEAVDEFIKATTMDKFAVEGTNSYKAYYNAGVISECTGQTEAALQYYSSCGDYPPAVKRLEQIRAH